MALGPSDPHSRRDGLARAGPLRPVVDMARLASPDLRVRVYSIMSDQEEAVRELVAVLRLDSTLASNLRSCLASRRLAMVAIKGTNGRKLAAAT